MCIVYVFWSFRKFSFIIMRRPTLLVSNTNTISTSCLKVKKKNVPYITHTHIYRRTHGCRYVFKHNILAFKFTQYRDAGKKKLNQNSPWIISNQLLCGACASILLF